MQSDDGGVVLQEIFLSACKTGDLALVVDCVKQGVNINCCDGWPLRRAIRYNHSPVWQYLVSCPDLDLNLVNQYGLTCLHTAARFGVTSAVSCLLSASGLHCINMKTRSGATALMVASKYGQRAALEVLVRDPRVDLLCCDADQRNVLQVVGAAAPGCDEALKVIICDIVKAESNKRALKRKKLEAVHPEQILVRQAREKLNKLISDLEDVQRVEMHRFSENIENNRREFIDKQDEDKENFFLKIQEEERMFYYNQDIQRSKFMSKMSRKKFQFERMQQELKEEFSTMEKEKLENFKDKQLREKETLLINQKSPQNTDRPQRWSVASLEVAQLTGKRNGANVKSKSLNGSIADIVAESSVARSYAETEAAAAVQPVAPDSSLVRSILAAAGCKHRKASCPPRLASGPTPGTPCTPPPSPALGNSYIRNNRSITAAQTTSSSNTSLNPSPVPSLEFIPSLNDLASSIPDTCPNIKALLALKILNPDLDDLRNSGPPSPESSPHYFTYPLMKQNSHPAPFVPVSLQSNITKSTPRISRKHIMEVVTEESDDNDETTSTIMTKDLVTDTKNTSKSRGRKQIRDFIFEKTESVSAGPINPSRTCVALSSSMKSVAASKSSFDSQFLRPMHNTSLVGSQPPGTNSSSRTSILSGKPETAKDTKCRVI